MKKIVLVDDAPDVLKLMLERLKEYKTHDLTVKAFEDPVTALTFLKDNEVDLVVTDFQMPHLNGIEFAQSIKISVSQSIPIFLHTGDDRKFPGELFDRIFSKWPFNQEHFFEAMDQFI